MNSNNNKLIFGLLAAGLFVAALGQRFASRIARQTVTAKTGADWESPVATQIITAPDDNTEGSGATHQTRGELGDI